MQTATLFNSDVSIGCEVPVPDGFKVEQRLNPSLYYPFELGGLGNVDLPPGEASRESGFPRVDLIPEGGALLWIVAYDMSWERDSSRRAQAEGVETRGVPGLMARAPRPSRWPNVTWFHTTVKLTATKRCQFFTFTGPAATAAERRIDELASDVRIVA
jgi:hypothetical protein